MSVRQPGHRLQRRVFFALLGAVHVIAFASFWAQAHGLVGEGGVSPAADTFAQMRRALSARGEGLFTTLPTLAWWGAGDTALHVFGAAGVVGGLLLAVGVAPRALCAVLWLLYLSVFHVGGPFLRFQWDILLIEATFAAIFYAPAGLWRPLAAQDEPSAASLWVMRLLVFKVMLMSGVVKLTSGDPTWADLTALDFHYWTQPLPHGAAWYAHAAPDWVRQGGVIFTFVVELLAPFLVILDVRGWRLLLLAAGTGVGLMATGGLIGPVFVGVFVGAAAVLDDRVLGAWRPTWVDGSPKGDRPAAFVVFTLLMAGIALTGNYGFFNLLTVALSVTLLDDRWLRRALPARLRAQEGESAGVPPPGHWRVLCVVAAAVLLPLSALKMLNMAGRGTLRAAAERVEKDEADLGERLLIGALEVRETLFEPLDAFATVNGYGLFATMTTTRDELVVEGSEDGQTWKAYGFRYKPDALDRVGPLVGVHMPRLDWQMWFAALAPRCGGGWFVDFVQALLEGRPDVLALLRDVPFPDAPPRYVRVRRVGYTFTTPEEREKTGHVWRTWSRGLYCPVLTLERLKAARR